MGSGFQAGNSWGLNATVTGPGPGVSPDKAGLKFGQDGLLPVVVQDAATGDVLMLAYANREAVERTLAEGRAWFYSRSRQALWMKGETSGNLLYVTDVRYDCDADALLYRVNPAGPACHTGERTCFHRTLWTAGQPERADGAGESDPGRVIRELEGVIADRRAAPREGSYVCRLLAEGRDRIIQKVGEEAVEVVIAAKNDDDQRLRSELADLFFHVTVLLAERDMCWDEVFSELSARRR